MCSFITQHKRAIGMLTLYVMDNEHRDIGPLLCHSSTTITRCCSMIMHGPILQGSVPGSWKHPSSCTASILSGHVTHWACLGCSGSVYTTACSSSCKYPAPSHSHWRGVDKHYTAHNQQPDQLYVKEMCCTAWSKWWSHQILTGFRTHPPECSAHFRVAFYCGQPKTHLCNNHAV